MTITRRALIGGAMAAMIPAPARAQAGHDVVLFLLDDFRDSDWLALPETAAAVDQEGRWFPNFTMNSPSCSPSRATALTGLHAHESGVWANNGPHGGFDAFRANDLGSKTIFSALPQGVRGGFFGKFINGYDGARYALPGASTWWATYDLAYRDFPVNVNGDIRTESGYYTSAQSDRLAHFLQDTPGPAFAYVACRAPHGPSEWLDRDRDAFPGARAPRTPAFNEDDVSDKPAGVRNRERVSAQAMDAENRDRLRSILPVDRMISRTLGLLRQRGRPFTVIVCSDNGYQLGEHRLKTKGHPYRASTVCRMAVIGTDFPHGTDDRMASIADLAPTVAARLGASMPWASGHDLAGGSPIDAALIQMRGRWSGYRTRDGLYVERAGGEREFYDLSRDPHELDNLLADWAGHVPSVDPGPLHDALVAMGGGTGKKGSKHGRRRKDGGRRGPARGGRRAGGARRPDGAV